MRLLSLIKLLLLLAAALLTSRSFAAIYSDYWPTVDYKGLSIILFVTLVLGLLAFKTKNS